MVYICDVPTWAAGARNARDEDLLASTYRGLASGEPSCDDDSASRLSCQRDFISVPVYLAQPVQEDRQARNNSVMGKRVATLIMMTMAMAIAITLVYHITESDATVEWRRTQHSSVGRRIAHTAHRAKGPRLRRLADVHDTLEQDEDPDGDPPDAQRRAHRRQPVEPEFVEPEVVEPGFQKVSEGRAAHHLDGSQPILRVYRAAERDEVQHPKLYEAPVEPPTSEELLQPWDQDEDEDQAE